MAEKQITVLFINNDGGGFAEKRSYPEGITAGELFAREMGTAADAGRHYIRVNRQPVPRNHEVQEGDRVSITPTKIAGAAEPQTIEVLFINNDGGGFAEKRTYPQGITAGELFAREMGTSADAGRHYIRVNRQPVPRNHEIVSGDRVSITPTKIAGAAGQEIEVLFINNDGGGFAEKRRYPAGITAGELFAREMGTAADAGRHYIRVNRQPVPRNHEVVSGDRVSITPTKIAGAVAHAA